MLQATTCPSCNTPEIKSKPVKISPETGERLSMLASYGGLAILLFGVFFVFLGLATLLNIIPEKVNGGGLVILAVIFIAPGFFLVYPWLKGGQEVLIEYKCRQCKHQWRWMENHDVFLLKAWLPGSLGILSETWMELGPNWFTLKNFNKHFDIRKEKASRQIEFLTTTYNGTGINSKLTGQPMINVGRRDGTIKGIVLESDGFQKLQQWVPTATARRCQNDLAAQRIAKLG